MNKTDFSEVNQAPKQLESYDEPWAIDFVSEPCHTPA